MSLQTYLCFMIIVRVERYYVPYYIYVLFFYRMEKWLNYALHGNIKIGADVTPFRMPSEADFVYL